MRPFVKGFIAFSVLLNLLLLGVVLGHESLFFMQRPMHQSLHEMAMALPEDKREHFEDTIRRMQQDTGDLQEQLTDGRKKAANLLKADPFDRDAYLAQMQRLHEVKGKIMQHMAETLAELSAQYSPDERAILADMFRRTPKPPVDDRPPAVF